MNKTPIIIDDRKKEKKKLFDLSTTNGRLRFFFAMAAMAMLCYLPGDLLYNNGMKGSGIMLWVIGGMCAFAMWVVPLWVTMMDDI